MRPRSIGVAALVLGLAISAARGQVIENGLHAIVESGGVPVKALDGAEIRLGEKLPDVIDKATIKSWSNDNDWFGVQLQRASPFSQAFGSIALYADGFCMRVSGGGSSPGNYLIEGSIGLRSAAEAFAKFFGVVPLLRAHPGYALATRFVPAKESFVAGEPLPVKLEIRNVGTKPTTFRVGGANRGARDNQFGFTAYGPSGAVLDTGNPNDLGGLSYNKTLNPGATFSMEVDLSKWFAFTKTGTYTITGTYRLAFFNPAGPDYFSTWEDVAAASFSLSIK